MEYWRIHFHIRYRIHAGFRGYAYITLLGTVNVDDTEK